MWSGLQAILVSDDRILKIGVCCKIPKQLLSINKAIFTYAETISTFLAAFFWLL